MDSRKTILVVEDDALIAMNTASLLKEYGYGVVTAANTETAIATVQKKDIDLILMDIDLGSGQRDGTIAAKIIMDEYDIPIVFLSSHTEREVVEKTEGITAYGYIVKNSGDTVLIASIKMAFKLFEAKMKEKAGIEALRESEKNYRRLFENAISGMAIHDIVLDASGKPIDYIFLEVNEAFETHTGLQRAEILGRRVREVIPGIEKSSFIKTYGKVALSGEPVSFEQFSEELGRYYDIHAFQVRPGRFTVVFNDITERRRAEEEVQSQRKKLEQKNIVLSEMLEQITFEKRRAVENIKQQITSLVIPIINEMESAGIDANYLHRLHHSLDTMFISERSERLDMSILSHREAEICNLIKGGLKNKEISSMLNISETTVAKHRMRIRKKLQIVNTDTNLETFLQSSTS